MATGVSVKMGVTGVAEFKRSIKDAESAVKAWDEALKLNEAQLKLNGNEQLAYENKVGMLKEQIKSQTEVVKQATAALEAMKKKGVQETSQSFQAMQAKVYSAETKLLEMKTSLKAVEENGAKAAEGLKKTDSAVDQIKKNTSWANVTKGIKDITSQLERGARAAVNFGKKITNSIKNSAQWADDLKTMSDSTGISVEKLQQIDKIAHIIETDAEAIVTAQSRMRKAATSTAGVKTIEELLGIDLERKTSDDMFWEIGESLMNMTDELAQEQAAIQIFGRSWRELVPLFKMGREEYEKMLSEQTVLTDEQVNKLGKVDDMFETIQKEIEQMKNQFWADNADKIMELMQWLIDHSDAVVAAVVGISGAFSAMKIVQFATNLQKTITAFQQLGLMKGGQAAAAAAGGAGNAGSAAAAGGGAAAAAGGSKWFSNLQNNLVNGMAVGQVFADMELLKQKYREFTAGKAEQDAMYEAGVQLFGSEEAYLEYWKNKGPGTSGGRSFGDPEEEEALLRLEQSAEKMAEAAEVLSGGENGSNSQNGLTSEDLSEFRGLPALMGTAVKNGMNGVRIVIGADAVSAISNSVSRSLAGQIYALVR